MAPTTRAEYKSLKGFGPREQTAVNGVNDWLCADLPATKESSIQALDRILASLYTVKLEIDVALGVRI